MIPFHESLLDYRSHELDNERYRADQLYYSSVDPAGKGPKIIFQVVPELASAKNRLHLDLHVTDIEQLTQRAVELGATRIDVQPIAEAGTRWIRLSDPEGNILCVVETG